MASTSSTLLEANTYTKPIAATKRAKKDEERRKEVLNVGGGGGGSRQSNDRKKARPSFLILVPELTLMRGTTVLKCAGPTTTAPMCLV